MYTMRASLVFWRRPRREIGSARKSYFFITRRSRLGADTAPILITRGTNGAHKFTTRGPAASVDAADAAAAGAVSLSLKTRVSIDAGAQQYTTRRRR